MKSNSHLTAHTDQCRVISLPHSHNTLSATTLAQNGNDLPFPIRRIFFLYDLPSDAERGGHSHYEGEQLIIAAAGCFDVRVTDGHVEKVFTLHRPHEALLIPAGIWRSLHNFSAGSICLTICSDDFSEADYVRDYNEFLQLSKDKI